MSFPRQVAVAIPYCPATHRILLVTSRNNKGMWILPKGGVEKGETSAQAAARESHEEAGTPLPTSPEDVSGLLISLEPHAPANKRQEVWNVHVLNIATEDALDPNWLEGAERERKWFSPDEAREVFELWGPIIQSELDADMSRGSTKKKAIKGEAFRVALAAFVEKYPAQTV